jgi:4-amino-4-deoxy-L-arabinose transferase-like glycosyltransferase
MTPAARVALAAAAVFVATAALNAPTLARPLGNGDEAVYAEMARGMVESGDLLTLRWQGAPCLYRPPASVWPLALAIVLAGPSEAAVRWPLALETAASAVLLLLIGVRRRSLAVGLTAAALFATARLTLHYAAYIESEPLLVAFCLGAWLAWEHARTAPAGRTRAWHAFGLCVGAALMVKPIVGGLPLILLLLARPARARTLATALALAAAPSLPWAAWQWARHGHAFVDAFFVANLVGRSLRPLLRTSTPLYYPLMMWRTESALALLFVVGIVHAAGRRDWPPLVWAAAALLPFTIVASRYDYYALPAYPALALVTAGALVEVRRTLAPVAAAVWAAVHLAGMLSAPPDVADPDSGALAADAALRMAAGAPLYVVDQVPYTARWYSQRRTIQIVFDAREYEETRRMLPAEVVLDSQATFAAVIIANHGWALVPKVYAAGLRPPLRVVAERGPYFLVAPRD